MEDNPRLKAFARWMRRQPAPTEQRVWRRLRDRRLSGFKFRRQHWLGPYIVDFYCPAAKLVIELDGDSHTTTGAPEADHARQAALEALGLRVLRFWNAEVFENEDGVVEAIWRACTERSSGTRMTPSPAGGAAPQPATSPPPSGGEVGCG